jgi:mediator of RNA polymerase II transcription subunit 8, fungi type
MLHCRPDLQTHAQLISNNFQAISLQLADADIFRSTVAFPTPQFPGASKPVILETLLRTKLEPDIEDWVKEGESLAAQQRKTSFRGLSDEDRNSLWEWAPSAANSAARKQTWGGDYTRAEQQSGIENVVTGLQRQLVEPPEDDGDEGPEDDDDDDEEEEYENTDEEEEGDDAMDVDKKQPQAETKPISTTPATPKATQMPLGIIHKFMTAGK